MALPRNLSLFEAGVRRPLSTVANAPRGKERKAV
jgi:hypothetical protein